MGSMKENARRKQQPKWLTVGDVSRLLYVHPNTVRRWADLGLLRSIRIGPRRDRRFTTEEIAQFLKESSKNGKIIGNDYLEEEVEVSE